MAAQWDIVRQETGMIVWFIAVQKKSFIVSTAFPWRGGMAQKEDRTHTVGLLQRRNVVP